MISKAGISRHGCIVQALAWYLRHPLSYRDLEEMVRERGFEVDHSPISCYLLSS